MLDTNKTIYVDVRDPSEFSEGHLEGALNIPVGSIDSTTQLGLPKDAKIVTYCNSGNRSGVAQKQLQAMGYTNVENGINQATIQSSL